MLLLFWSGASVVAVLAPPDQEAVYTLSLTSQNHAIYRFAPEGSTRVRYAAHEADDGVQYVSKPSGRGVS